MSSFEKNVSFFVLDVSIWMNDRPTLVRKSMDQIFDLIGAGKLHAARPLHVYGIDDTENAIRYLQEGRHIGKTVIETKKELPVPVGAALVFSQSFH